MNNDDLLKISSTANMIVCGCTRLLPVLHVTLHH